MATRDTIGEVLDLVPYNEEKSPPKIEPFVDDYEYAKKNMKEIIEAGKTALTELSDLALQTQHPRAYEVLSNHIKILLDAQKGLLELTKINNEVSMVNNNNTQVNQTKINNSIVVGSTADLQKILNEMSKKND